MINLLLNKEDWTHEFDWGTSSATDLTNAVYELTKWNDDGSVNFEVGYKDPLIQSYNTPYDKSYKGWIRDEFWNKVDWYTQYGYGRIISKQKYGFGTYEIKCNFPNFKGSWPAFWMLDVDGLPPEIDIFEHFRKDGCLTRFHISTTYHDGPTYGSGNVAKAKYRIRPMDWGVHKIKMIWTAENMTFYFNGKKYFTLYASDWDYYPVTPMNIIVNSGIGAQWGTPDVSKFEPFIVKSLTYDSL